MTLYSERNKKMMRFLLWNICVQMRKLFERLNRWASILNLSSQRSGLFAVPVCSHRASSSFIKLHLLYQFVVIELHVSGVEVCDAGSGILDVHQLGRRIQNHHRLHCSLIRNATEFWSKKETMQNNYEMKYCISQHSKIDFCQFCPFPP